jgi:hypothetical protein
MSSHDCPPSNMRKSSETSRLSPDFQISILVSATLAEQIMAHIGRNATRAVSDAVNALVKERGNTP